ncbi:hypothetical protein DFH28DRAFT_1081904 [Melampsora americana]|nr:hypothetical protein DFH28DRAFT_1081904 [Melampsora americana]
MSYLSLGLNLPAMFAMHPFCIFKKATISQSKQAAYVAHVDKLHPNQKLITGPSILTEEISIPSPAQSDLPIFEAIVPTTAALESITLASVEPVLEQSLNILESCQTTTSAVQNDDSELFFCNEIMEYKLYPDGSFQNDNDHPCFDLDFDFEASFGDHHISVHLDPDFDCEISFNSHQENHSLDHAQLHFNHLSQEETPQFQIYNQMLKDILGLSEFVSLELSLPYFSSEPQSLTPSHDLMNSVSMAQSLIEESYGSYIDWSSSNISLEYELEQVFENQSDSFDFDLSIKTEASFGDHLLSVHIDQDLLNPLFAEEDDFHFDQSHPHEVQGSISFSPPEVERLEEIPDLEIYNQMLQDLLGSSDINSLESTSNSLTTFTTGKTLEKPRRQSSFGLLPKSFLSKSTSYKSEFDSSDSHEFSSVNSFQSKLIIDELEDELSKGEEQVVFHVDQSFKIEFYSKFIDLNDTFCL